MKGQKENQSPNVYVLAKMSWTRNYVLDRTFCPRYLGQDIKMLYLIGPDGLVKFSKISKKWCG